MASLAALATALPAEETSLPAPSTVLQAATASRLTLTKAMAMVRLNMMDPFG